MTPFKVIVADDEVMVKKTLRMLLQRLEDFEWAGEAEDGHEALGLAAKLHPDVVITDVSMPVMTGLELLERLRKLPVSPETVILSGYDDFPYIQQAIRLGAADYLLKPLKPAQFEETMRRVACRIRSKRKAAQPAWEWLPFCEIAGKEIADKVWMLDRKAVDELLTKIGREIGERELLPHHSRLLWSDLFLIVCAELNKRAGTYPDSGTPDAGNLPEQSLDAVKNRLYLVMDRIRESRNWSNHHLIVQAAQEVERRYTDPALSMQRLAASMDMSPAMFSRAFKAEMGVSFVQYVTDKRMEKARQLLEKPQMRITDAACMAGFSDYPHFTKLFKRHYGLSPSEYRKRLGVP